MSQRTLDFVMRARDETGPAVESAKARMRGLGIGDVRAAAGGFLGLSLIRMVMDAGIATSRELKRVESESASAFMEHQQKIREGWSQVLGDIPLIGHAARRVMEEVRGDAAFKALVENIRKAETALQGLAAEAQKSIAGFALRMAQVTGAAPLEILREKQAAERAAMQAQIDAAYEAADMARRQGPEGYAQGQATIALLRTKQTQLAIEQAAELQTVQKKAGEQSVGDYQKASADFADIDATRRRLMMEADLADKDEVTQRIERMKFEAEEQKRQLGAKLKDRAQYAGAVAMIDQRLAKQIARMQAEAMVVTLQPDRPPGGPSQRELIAEQAQRERRNADERARLQIEMLRAAGRPVQAAQEEIRQKYRRIAEQNQEMYQDDARYRRGLRAMYDLEMSQATARRAGGMSEIQSMASRFLSRPPGFGQGAEPEKYPKQQVALLKLILDAVKARPGVVIAGMRL